MSAIIEKISNIITSCIEQEGAYLVEVNLRGERTSKVVEIYLDSDEGITIEKCSVISRKISALLDEANLIEGRYRLDVSSPGLDRPLKLQRQYKKNIGRNCKVQYLNEEKKSTVEGELKNISETHLTIQTGKNTELQIPVTSVIETYIIPKIKS
ncbi:MAG: ribosome maturation factor RimP [Bacteroidetes bacterium]|nr:ribosome maturation factor RimP [Bacteroidota bacterium]